MVDITATLFLYLSGWIDSCPCHDSDATPGERSFRSRERKSYWKRILGKPCRMICRRAPDLAAGRFLEFLRLLARVYLNGLLFELAKVGVQGQDRAVILRDFDSMRHYVHLIFNIQFGHWQQLPWILAGTASSSLGVARGCARRALAMFAGAPGGRRHHFVEMLLCAPGSRGHYEMTAFVNGEDPRNLPLLLRMMARFRFILTSERWVEALHAANKHWLSTAHHAGAVHVAFRSCLPVLKARLEHDPGCFHALADHCMNTRNIVECLKTIGFELHPRVREILATEKKSSLHRKYLKELMRMIYHVDPRTLYQDLPDKLPIGPVPPPPPAPPPGPGPLGLGLQNEHSKATVIGRTRRWRVEWREGGTIS